MLKALAGTCRVVVQHPLTSAMPTASHVQQGLVGMQPVIGTMLTMRKAASLPTHQIARSRLCCRSVPLAASVPSPSPTVAGLRWTSSTYSLPLRLRSLQCIQHAAAPMPHAGLLPRGSRCFAARRSTALSAAPKAATPHRSPAARITPDAREFWKSVMDQIDKWVVAPAVSRHPGCTPAAHAHACTHDMLGESTFQS